MEEYIKQFLDYLAKDKNYASNTLAAYHSDLSQLAVYIRSQESEEVVKPLRLNLDIKLLAGYMHYLKERKYAQSTIARKIAAAKSFLKYLVDSGKLKRDQTPKLTSPQVNKPVPKPLSISEVRRFLAEPAKHSGPEAKRDKTMLELLYATGLRASELMSLNVSDIDLKKNCVYCYSGNSRVRVIPIDNYIVQMIKEYLTEARPRIINNEIENALILNRRGERLTRQGFWQIIQGYADKVGLYNKVTPRSMRHSFAVHKLNSGVDLQSIQELLGHTHISTTRVYRDVRGDSS